MEFRAAAESDTYSAKAHWGMARAYEDLGQFNETLDELRKTVELDSTNLDAKAKLGNYFLLVQPPMIDEAGKVRDEILGADPKFIEGTILTASIMAAQKKPETDVVSVVNRAITMDPKRVETYVSLERFYTTREKYPDAEAAIKRGIQANPTAALGYTEYGRFLSYGERDNEAEAQFKKAVEVDPLSIEAREAIAQFYVDSRQFAKAEGAYRDLVAMQQNGPESRLELAGFYSSADRKDEAIAVLNQIIAETPEFVLARYKVAEMYLDRHENQKVYEQLDALFAINNNDTEALMLRARVEIQESKNDEAIKDLEEILKKQPSNRDALYLTAQAHITLGQVDEGLAFVGDLDRYHPAYLKTSVLKIQAAFSTGDTNGALKLSNELIDKAKVAVPSADQPASAIADAKARGMTSRGLAYLDLGKVPQAKADLQEVLRLSPNSSSSMVNLAKVVVAENNQIGALELYERALAADGQNFDAITGIVNTSIQLKQTQRAHAAVDSLIAADAGRNDLLAALHYLKSTIFSAEKNPGSAESELLASIQLDENYLPAYSAYASLLASQNRTDEAIAQYQRSIDKKPAAQIYTMLGILEDGRGHTSDAERDYRAALEIAPESPIAANNLAWLIADNQGNLDEALHLARTAINKNQTVAGFYDTLGWVYLKKGLALPAVEQFKKAVALEESNSRKLGTAPDPAYRTRLAMALSQAGNRSLANRQG